MKVSLTTANEARGVSVDALKRALRIEGDTSQDTLLGELLDARQRWAEKLAGVSVLEATWTATWDRDDLTSDSPCIEHDERSGWAGVRLPVRPVTDVTTVKITDSEHTQTTVDAEDYILAIDADGAAVLYLNTGVLSSARETACLEVVFVAGWEDDEIPQALIKGVTIGAAHDYESPDEPDCKAAERSVVTERPVRLA